jgi:H2-forming N5,N10-methylenetetrahydromethanopterin dehydrogenase-like enzyme
MFEIKVDQPYAIVEFVLAGLVDVSEMDRFVKDLEKATLSLKGRAIKIKADVRALRPAAPTVAEMIKEVQAFGIKSGVKRVAEIVESDVVALQLNRVARESGTEKILRRFWDDESAREWLIHGDPPPEFPDPAPRGR